MFSHFVWKKNTDVLLPAKGLIEIPVIFNHYITEIPVLEKYLVIFDQSSFEIPNDSLTVIGQVKEQNLSVEPSMLNLGISYLESYCPRGSFKLHNTGRIVVQYKLEVPQQLEKYLELNPLKGYLKAESSLEVHVQLNLKYDIIHSLKIEKYFDVQSGFLDFPIRIYLAQRSKHVCEVHVSTVVSTSFGLKLSPDFLNFGTVSTSETVVRVVILSNHSQNTLKYGFINLPEMAIKSNKNFLNCVTKFIANKMFFAWLPNNIRIIPVVCFVQLCGHKVAEYFGFEKGSLKLSLICPISKPNFIVFNNNIDFEQCVIGVRHNEWILIHNVTDHNVPFRISIPNPTGPFFCDLALNSNNSIQSNQTIPINISFNPEHEFAVNEKIEIISSLTRVTVKLSGIGVKPSCTIIPDNLIFETRSTKNQHDGKITFQVKNIGPSTRFNVQMEWTKICTEGLASRLSLLQSIKINRSPVEVDLMSWLGGSEWTWSNVDVFDLGNGGKPLWFYLKTGDVGDVKVFLKLDDHFQKADDENEIDKHDSKNLDHLNSEMSTAVYASKLNVHVGHTVLKVLYLFGFVNFM
ncbi:uncharacterized protein LOC126895698 [Daktulosphaira vitifoliae]|uniref:uncharacterized protein LOC126895698 n=1 Tax=Daktulosphaira vitifoliae TaxID=58002 RepID=UPI0021AABDB9|nr:uncharacterized protein LOC126895698 [Daktulosphaira vitifoliae]